MERRWILRQYELLATICRSTGEQNLAGDASVGLPASKLLFLGQSLYPVSASAATRLHTL